MPTTLAFARVSAERQQCDRSFVPTWVFIASYLAAWTGYGLVAYGLFRVIQSAHIDALLWHAEGPLIAGSAIVAAGLYQLSPLKRSCLRRCRSPVQSVRDERHPGWWGAVRMGFEHGAFCVGCCWGLMLILLRWG
jgi:predicted metal-binding membrane protein